jgi:hypothetical protein
VLKQVNKICRKLGINHTTIQVHDAADKHFCYSETCDWEHRIDTSEAESAKESGSSKNKQSCMTSRSNV